jgi:hypothetical protein
MLPVRTRNVTILFTLFFLSYKISIAQNSEDILIPKDKSFKVDLDFRTRAEYRNGFRDLPTDTGVGAFFVNQRARVGFTYEQINKFKFHTSIQDVRVLGYQDPRSLAGTVQIFEAYAEPFLTPKISIKIGRQKLAFDNQRLFAENDWRVNSGAHDALNFRYNDIRFISELVFAFNQNTERNYGTDFSPVGFSNYKTLGVSYLKYKVSDSWVLSSINAADGYQDIRVKEKIYQRFTVGGRIEYINNGFYATLSGYKQTGLNAKGTKLLAWYIQPELKYARPGNFSVRLGAEVFSGNNGEGITGYDHSFVPLYGVNHRFNGSMEYFTNKPSDLGYAGLVDTYLFLTKNIGKKVEFRVDFHIFESQNNVVYKDKALNGKVLNATADKYLGAENDLLLSYTPNAFTKLDLGFSYAHFSSVVEILRSLDVTKKSGNSSLIPTWFYVSVSFKPQLFKTIFN